MSEINPLVSIIVPTYNRADLIIETLQSVKTQTYNNWECIIIDDGSSDNTELIVIDIIKSENRISYFKREREPKGAPTCRNIGLAYSRGEYIIFLDSDDLLSETCLQKRIEFVNKNPGYFFYCFPTGVFNNLPYDTNVVWNYLNEKNNDLIRFLQQDMPWCVYGAMWYKPFLKKIDGWDESLICWQDWDIHVRALMNKDTRYLKVEDKLINIDSFYRLKNNYSSIAKAANTKEYVGNKMSLLNKIALPEFLIEQAQIRLEFARLSYRIAKEAVPLFGFKSSKIFLKSNLAKVGFNSIFIFIWLGYLYNLCNQKENKGLRRIYNIAPRIYAKRSLMLNESTHLKAVYTQ